MTEPIPWSRLRGLLTSLSADSSRDDLESVLEESAELFRTIASHDSVDGAGREHAMEAAIHCDLVLGDEAEVAEIQVALERVLELFELVAPDSDGESAVAPVEDDIDDELMAELLEAFLQGCTEQLTELEAQVLAIDEALEPEEHIATTKRILHNMKGDCGIISLGLAQDLLHRSEDLILEREKAREPFPVDAILALGDWMSRYLELLADDAKCEPPATDEVESKFGAVTSASSPPSSERVDVASAEAERGVAVVVGGESWVQFDPDALEDEALPGFVETAGHHLREVEVLLETAQQSGADSELLQEFFRCFNTIKGVAGFLHLGPIMELAHETRSILDGMRNGVVQAETGTFGLIAQSCVLAHSLLRQLVGEPGLEQAHLDSHLEALRVAGEQRTPVTRNQNVNSERPVAPRQSRSSRREVNVKVNTERLDLLVDLVGELVIAQQMVNQDPEIQGNGSDSLTRKLSQVSKITRDLQESSMALRMVTLRTTFQRMARLVRDTASKAGRKVKLTILGEDTELDRTVVEEIGDPLVHMIRNAIDHGIEVPERRRELGKPEYGQLVLRAFHQGGSIIIEVEDDGQGLNRERIFQKAVDRGLLPRDQNMGDLSESEIENMIFMPGFSTAEKITDISGRGVGMDVVRQNIEALRGKMEIRSRPGEGSTFRICLPLTLAIIDGMLIRVGQERFVIPTESIERSFRPGRDDVETVLNRGETVCVQGTQLPVHRLYRLFHLHEGVEDPARSILIALDVHGTRYCLQVDEILGQQQVVIKSLGKGIRKLRGVSGAAILGDGRVGLILDVASLLETRLSRIESEQQDAELPMVPANNERARPGAYLTFRLGGQIFGIDVLRVREITSVVEVTALPNTPSHFMGVINLRGTILPIVDLRKRLGASAAAYSKESCFVIVEVERESDGELCQMGCVVDQVEEVTTLTADQLEEAPELACPEQDFVLGLGKRDREIITLVRLGRVFESLSQVPARQQSPAALALSGVVS